MKKLVFSLLVLGLIGVAFSLPSQVGVVPTAQADNDNRRTLVLDVAFDGRTFVLNPVTPGAPGFRGDTFVVNGKIFPGGTIPRGGTITDPGPFDPDTAGSIGEFICRGTLLFSDAEIAMGAGPFVATTQTLVLHRGTLVTDGLEGNVSPIQRVLTGGTGDFSGVNGHVTLRLLGFNNTGVENYRFTFRFKNPDSD